MAMNLRPLYQIAAPLLLIACASQPESKTDSGYITLSGNAQGTTFTIQYLPEDTGASYHEEVDSLFRAIDQSLSLWVEGSLINRFNTDTLIEHTDRYFHEVLNESRRLHALTGGAYNPAMGVLIDAWGFGAGDGPTADTSKIDSLRALVAWDFSCAYDSARGIYVAKNPALRKVNFNAMAQGYTVDVLCNFLEAQSVLNYLVEVGGEMRTKGRSPRGDAWAVGIDKPLADSERSLQEVIELNDAALATSGNYRKFYERDGKRFPHTIDPATGYPVTHQLLSATVLAPNCATADAFATAFLVMGADSAMRFVNSNPELELSCLLISAQGDSLIAARSAQFPQARKQ